MPAKTAIELLAPARDFEHGAAAIECGADAVYVGASRFGARSAAGNSVGEIAKLVRRARFFGAKVYATLNTLLFDDELDQARQTAWQLYDAGVDALIVQDMAFMELDLPPVELHASTQTFNLHAGRIKFLADSGFSRVILERAATLDQIRDVRRQTDVPLEAFVHGAICVCYSGQCYMSQAVCGRSGNRGVCSQPCRSSYNLMNDRGDYIARGRHLLSVTDLDLSTRIGDLIDAGVASFKIEGRLKDMAYLRNSVAHYRRVIDGEIASRNDLMRSSFGKTTLDFTPDPEETFSRGFSEYFLVDRQNKVSSFDTQKSIGKQIGTVLSVAKTHFTLDKPGLLNNGDGICFIHEGVLRGTNVNKAEGALISPNKMEGIVPGVRIFRNFNRIFTDMLLKSRTKRTVSVRIKAVFAPGVLRLSLLDEAGRRFEKESAGSWEAAKNQDKALAAFREQFSRTGDTGFLVEAVEVDLQDGIPFIPLSELNAIRREAFAGFADRIAAGDFPKKGPLPRRMTVDYGSDEIDYRANVTNALSEKFYRDRGVKRVGKGFECRQDYIGKEVMRTRYCIRREMDLCLKQPSCSYRGPLTLENNGTLFGLQFDCGVCEMSLIYKEKEKSHKI